MLSSANEEAHKELPQYQVAHDGIQRPIRVGMVLYDFLDFN